MPQSLFAGAAVADITPDRPMFLYGYPHTPRISTGVHDPLLSVAICLETDGHAAVFIANDVIFVSKSTCRRVRARVADATGISPQNILIAATHTHSGPVTLDYLSNGSDPVVPKADPAYLRQLEHGMTRAAIDAWLQRRPAEIGFVRADATGIGTNRHDVNGPSDLSVPVLAISDAVDHAPIGLLLVCAMHPTVLHEDSTLISGDFPAAARMKLQHILGTDCPVAWFMGASGNQSPRHVTRGQTFAEADRLGRIVSDAVLKAMKHAQYDRNADLRFGQAAFDLPTRVPPTIKESERLLREARGRLDELRSSHAAPTAIRTAECDWFGAEETLAIAKAAAEGRITQALADVLPAEIQVIAVGQEVFVGWPGEFFVEFSLAVRELYPHTHIITCANGDLQGYVVTQEAIDQNRYEAGNALLRSPETGELIVRRTVDLLREVVRQPMARGARA